MKRSFFSISSFFIFFTFVNGQHFMPAYLEYSENPYLAMNITAVSAVLEGIDLESGDEIGIFDGDNCVGVSVLTGEIAGYIDPVAGTDDPGTSEVDGFTGSGTQPISFRLWDASASLEIIEVDATWNVAAPVA